MQKYIYITLLISSLLNAVEIRKSKEFTSSIASNIQKSSFSINHKASTSYKIEMLFNQAISIANSSNICSGGKYSIYPNYKYIKNERVDDGYNSNIKFDCNFKNIKEYRGVISKIKSLNLKITQNQIEHTITQELKDREINKLENSAFDYAKKYKNHLNSQFNNCSIKLIELNRSSYKNYNPSPMLARSSTNSTEVTSPIKEPFRLKLNTNYIFECQ